MIAARALLLSVLVWGWPSMALAQLAPWERVIRDDLNSLISVLHQRLSAVAGSNVQDISVRVIISRRLCDLSYHRPTRTVTIGTGAAAMIRAVTDASLLTQTVAKKGALTAYLNYMNAQVKASRGFIPIEEYLGLGPNEVRAWSARSGERQGLFALAMAFVLAHEMGHHAHNHEAVACDASGIIDCNMKIQAHETEADGWAIDTLVAAGIPPVAGAYALLFDAFRDREAMASPELSSHPPSPLRIQKMVVRTLETLDGWFKPELFGINKVAYREQLRTLYATISAELARVDVGE